MKVFLKKLKTVIENLPGINEGFLEKGKKEVFRRENYVARRLPPRVTPTLATPLQRYYIEVGTPVISMVWLNLKFNFKIVIISIQKSFLLLILIPFLSGLFHSYSNSISNSFPFLLSISVKNSFPFPFLFPLMEISLSTSSDNEASAPKCLRICAKPHQTRWWNLRWPQPPGLCDILEFAN